MLRQSLNTRSIQLRDSYIAISNYVRCGHARPNRQFSCLRDRSRRTDALTTHLNAFSTFRNLNDLPRTPQDEDITRGFPEPPESVLLSKTLEENEKAQTQTPRQPSEESLPSDPGPDVSLRTEWLKKHNSSVPNMKKAPAPSQEHLVGSQGHDDGAGDIQHSNGQYKYMGPFEKATHSWEMLQNIQDAKIDDTRYPVVLHGYITSTRSSSRFTDYLHLLDPNLRKTIQVMVTKDISSAQPTPRANAGEVRGVGLNAPTSHDVGKIPEKIQAQDASSAFCEASRKDPGMHSQSLADDCSEHASEDDTHPSLQGSAESSMTSSQQVSASTPNQNNELSHETREGGHQDIPAHSVNPVCTGYKKIRPHTPVVVSGIVCQRKPSSTSIGSNTDGTHSGVVSRVAGKRQHQRHSTSRYQDPYVGEVERIDWIIIKATNITALNEFPPTIIAKNETNFPPEDRHLQLRTKHHLRQTIRARSKAMAQTRKFMFMKGFDEIETPLLFKSTPEGAREFMVPTRKKGMAYALPQSPQQYKQILMASGISRYFQFARCFRDEDMRADRQPEFTQLDLEMAFATRSEVMFVVERLLTQMLWPSFFGINPYQNKQLKDPELRDSHIDAKTSGLFPRISYKQAMRFYGSDKPDVRLSSKIQRVERYLPPNLKQMLSPLGDAVFEMIKIDMKGVSPAVSGEFITRFLDAPAAAPYLQNPAGAPGVTVLDPAKPLQGLASFGHEAADKVMSILEPNVGDILIVQARADVPHTGGSTPLGNLRRDIYQSAFAEEVLAPPTDDSFLWVVDFPLFSPINDTDPGQGGQAGFCSTHHPFTAPVNEEHIGLLTKDPLKCDGDHYDLVINGVEVGGGSRRIHDSKLQEFILRDVLKMRPERVEDFRHLLDALNAGCPPHAGFALGFDRLMAILTRQSSMRDVIAFPKWGDGEDKMVGAPSRITEDQLKTYHLGIR